MEVKLVNGFSNDLGGAIHVLFMGFLNASRRIRLIRKSVEQRQIQRESEVCELGAKGQEVASKANQWMERNGRRREVCLTLIFPTCWLLKT